MQKAMSILFDRVCGSGCSQPIDVCCNVKFPLRDLWPLRGCQLLGAQSLPLRPSSAGGKRLSGQSVGGGLEPMAGIKASREAVEVGVLSDHPRFDPNLLGLPGRRVEVDVCLRRGAGPQVGDRAVAGVCALEPGD